MFHKFAHTSLTAPDIFLAGVIAVCAGWLLSPTAHAGETAADTTGFRIIADNTTGESLPAAAVVLESITAMFRDGGIEETAYLHGVPFDESSPFMRECLLEIGNGMTRMIFHVPGAAGSGYSPTLDAGDFDGDGRADILVTSSTGGSGGIVNGSVVTFGKDAPRLLFDTAETAIPHFSGWFTDDYHVDIHIVETGATCRIDVGHRAEYYDNMDVYREGKLLKPVEVWGGAYSSIAPVAIHGENNGGKCGLRVIQVVRGTSNADRPAEIRSVLAYRDGRWRVHSVAVQPLTHDRTRE